MTEHYFSQEFGCKKCRLLSALMKKLQITERELHIGILIKEDFMIISDYFSTLLSNLCSNNL